jgi:hypothetical protein
MNELYKLNLNTAGPSAPVAIQGTITCEPTYFTKKKSNNDHFLYSARKLRRNFAEYVFETKPKTEHGESFSFGKTIKRF